MHVIRVPAFADNYLWLLVGDDGTATAVDPGDADAIERALASSGLRLRAILITHHHDDHIGGVAALVARHAVPVYGPVDPRIPQVDHPVADGDRVELAGWPGALTVIAVPGHTRSHIAYVDPNGHLFCGDTLFVNGCGRMFEGTPAQMLASLDRIAALPGDTLVCCAHEYTAGNCRFALTIEPDNAALQRRWQDVQERRARNEATVPSRIADERDCNPFLRTGCASIGAAYQRQHGQPAADRTAVFAWLRSGKDEFRG